MEALLGGDRVILLIPARDRLPWTKGCHSCSQWIVRPIGCSVPT